MFAQPVGQHLGDFPRGLKTVFRPFGHHPSHNRDQPRGDLGRDLGERGGLFGLMGQQPGREGSFRERRLSRQEEVKGAAQTVDIGPHVDRVAVERLFGREVVGRSQHFFIMATGDRRIVPLIKKPHQSQVEHLDRAPVVQQQVGWFDVAVNQIRLVGLVQPLGGLPDVFRGRDRRQRSLTGDNVLQRPTRDVLHHQEVNIPFLIDIVGPHDVAVIEGGDRLRFLVKPFQMAGAPRTRLGQHLDRHPPPHQPVLGQIHGTHPPRPQVREQPVLAQQKPLVPPLQQFVGLPAGQQLPLDEEVGESGRVGQVLGIEPDLPQGQAQSLSLDQPALAGQPNEHFRGEFRGGGHWFAIGVKCEDTSVDLVNPAPRMKPRTVFGGRATQGGNPVSAFATLLPVPID